MDLRRPLFGIALIVIVIANLSGCATRGRSSLAPRAERGLPPLPLKTAMDVVDEINRNAKPVETLEATAKITATDPDGKKITVDGRFALQRPRDFTLKVLSHRGTEADIGSNEQRFWLWTRDSKDKNIYLCDYDENGKAPLALGIQPDWIVEALGLRVIPESEVAASKLTRGTGDHEGTYILTQRMHGSDGLEYVKSTYLSQASNAIVEHRMDVIKNGTVTPMSRATISGYTNFPYSDASSGAENLKLPSKFKLTWYAPQRMDMDITLLRASPNKPLDQARFEEPRYPGYARVQLNDRQAVAGDTAVRETRPAPPVSGAGGIKLGTPQPLGGDASTRVSPSLRGQGPLPLGPDLAGVLAPGGEVVGPKVPSAPGQEGLAVPLPSTARRPTLYIER